MDHASQQAEVPEAFNPVDPHGQHERIHHHVYSWQFLTGILFILLFFTFLTILVSDAESWLVKSVAITIPDFVNVLIAMSIATVKAMFVVMYFMGLRRGNPLNVLIFLFTLFAFALFIGFTAIDLGNRDHAYPYKGKEIQAGGNGASLEQFGTTPVSGKPIYMVARENAIAKYGQDKWEAKYNASAGHDDHHAQLSSPNQHVHRTGLTPGLFDTSFTAPSHDATQTDGHPTEKHPTDTADTHTNPESPATTPATTPAESASNGATGHQ
jgi:cytochrome c oxidase subunit 4